MRTSDIRHLKTGDPLAVKFTLKVTDEFGSVRYEPDGRGGWKVKTEDVWVAAYVLDCGPGSAFPESPVIDGANSVAQGFIRAFHSGVVDSYSAADIMRLPRAGK